MFESKVTFVELEKWLCCFDFTVLGITDSAKVVKSEARSHRNVTQFLQTFSLDELTVLRKVMSFCGVVRNTNHKGNVYSVGLFSI